MSPYYIILDFFFFSTPFFDLTFQSSELCSIALSVNLLTDALNFILQSNRYLNLYTSTNLYTYTFTYHINCLTPTPGTQKENKLILSSKYIYLMQYHIPHSIPLTTFLPSPNPQSNQEKPSDPTASCFFFTTLSPLSALFDAFSQILRCKHTVAF